MDSAGVSTAQQSSHPRKSSRLLGIALVLAGLASASTWFYIDHVQRAQQIADAAAHGTPRGNLSDLYPRWLGARELLLHRRNPYSAEITREIQRGYYGRPLDPARAEDPKDQVGFVYPAYVVFLLAPTVNFPFGEVQIAFHWFLIVLTVASVLLWTRFLRWKIPHGYLIVLAALTLGWLPVVQGIKVQQLSLLVAGLLAGCCVCLAGGWLLLAGGLLALATIKPQLAWPVVLWLLVWGFSHWQMRKRFLIGFAFVMVLLLGGAELILPGWLKMFVTAIGQYHRYTHNQSVLAWTFGPIAGRMIGFLCFLACALIVWRSRHAQATSREFAHASALVLALTIVIVPMFMPYNQVLLLPAILVLVEAITSPSPILPAFRLAGIVGFLPLLWPWIATLSLTALYPWLTPNLRQHLWLLPYYSNFTVPLFIFAWGALAQWSHGASGLREPFAAE
jgi:Glycosyltransferase family 87